MLKLKWEHDDFSNTYRLDTPVASFIVWTTQSGRSQKTFYRRCDQKSDEMNYVEGDHREAMATVEKLFWSLFDDFAIANFCRTALESRQKMTSVDVGNMIIDAVRAKRE